MCLAKPHGRINTPNDFIPRISDFNVFNGVDNFDKDAVKVLNDILLKNNDFDIVVSSDWKRFFPSIKEMQLFYTKQRIIKQPIDWTPNFPNVTIPTTSTVASVVSTASTLVEKREWEIMEWVRLNSTKTWIAIDDLYLKNLPEEKFCWITRTDMGLSEPKKKEEILAKILLLNSEIANREDLS